MVSGYSYLSNDCRNGGNITPLSLFPFLFPSVSPSHLLLQGEKGLVHKLVHIDRPILNIPNICIHLARDIHTSFAPNKETHMYVFKYVCL